MKIIFRIMIILVFAAIVAGAFNLAFGSRSSSTGGEFSGRPDGREGRSGSSGAGLLGVHSTLNEVAAIVGLVTGPQNGIKLLINKSSGPARTA
jgi:hypothetical protein